MTCTIHYSLHAKSLDALAAKSRLESLRQRAYALPFSQVSEMFDFNADEWRLATSERSHPLFEIAMRASLDPDRIELYKVAPVRTLAFKVSVGKGCENAVFGLRQWDEQAGKEDYDPKSWGWHAFSKTYPAKSVDDVHFLRCHLSLIRLLDHAQELDILGEVRDEGGFWQDRDWELLAERTGCKHTLRLHLLATQLQGLLWHRG